MSARRRRRRACADRAAGDPHGRRPGRVHVPWFCCCG